MNLARTHLTLNHIQVICNNSPPISLWLITNPLHAKIVFYSKRDGSRKRHIVTDAIGIVLRVKVTDANVSDNKVAIELLTEIFSGYITIQLVCADAGYRGELGDWLYLTHRCQLEIAPTLGQSGFVVVPLRWIVERTFSWLGWFRRLTLDYERSAETAEAMVYIASIYLMRNRIK